MSNVVPEGWAIETIGDIAFVKGGKRLPKGETFSENKTEYPYIRVTDFKNGGIDQRDLRFVDESIRNKIKRYVISSNDLYISIAGTLGLVGEVPNNLDGALLIENAAKIVFKQQCQSNKSYFKYYLNSDEPQHSFNQAKGTGGGVPKLALFRIEETQTLLPPLPEQKKIAAILTSVDEVIEKTQAQIDKLKDLKTAMMQELLTCGVGVDGKPHTEFKDSPVGRIPKGWEVVELGKVGAWKGGGTPSKSNHSFWNGHIPWVSPKDMKMDVISNTEDYITESAIKGSSTNLLPRDSMLIVVRSGILKHTLPVAISGCDLTINQDMKALVISSQYCVRFIFHYIQANNHKLLRATLKAGNTVESIDFNEFSKYQIPSPPLSEQKLISSTIDSILTKIDIQSTRLVRLKNTKKALMQDLLTGKVRVKVD